MGTHDISVSVDALATPAQVAARLVEAIDGTDLGTGVKRGTTITNGITTIRAETLTPAVNADGENGLRLTRTTGGKVGNDDRIQVSSTRLGLSTEPVNFSGGGEGSLAAIVGSHEDNVCWNPWDGYSMTAGTLQAGSHPGEGQLCSTRLFFNPLDQDGAGCSGGDGDDDQAYGPAWSTGRDKGCPFDDPGYIGSLGGSAATPTHEYTHKLAWPTGPVTALQAFVRRAICGNDEREGDEGCDDGNTDDGDGCSAACLAEVGTDCEADEACEDGLACVGEATVAAATVMADIAGDLLGNTIVLTNTDGTSVTFTMALWIDPGDQATQIEVGGINNTEDFATHIKAAFDAAVSAGTLKMAVSDIWTNVDGDATVITLTQVVAGTAGNTAIDGTLISNGRVKCNSTTAGQAGPDNHFFGGTNGPGTCTPMPDGYVYIPAGTFVMGSPVSEPCRLANETEHQVTLTGSFWLKTTEVTQGEWSALMGNNPSQKSSGCGDCPVEYVNWYESLAYCNALSAAEGLPECYTLTGCGDNEPGTDMACTGVSVNAPGESVYACEGYRLPTEAEWEYAARVGTTEATYNGDIALENCYGVSPVLEPIAWYNFNSGSTTHPVAEKDANPWGLYDMLGNVWEWTWDKDGSYDSGASQDPTGASSGSFRVHRGCSWNDVARRCRAADRARGTPVDRVAGLGFRPARTHYPDDDGDGVSSASDCDDNDPDLSLTCCGDGTVDDGEGCDDGGTADGDGCSATCLAEVEADCTTSGDCVPGAWCSGAVCSLLPEGYVHIPATTEEAANTPLTATEIGKLLASDGAALDDFGRSVTLDGDTALVGAVGDDGNGANSGSVHIFTRTGNSWTQQAKLLPSDGVANDKFGWSVALDGDTALVGAVYDDDNGEDSGSAYIFTRSDSSWTQQAKLLPSDGAAGDRFGWSIAFSGDTALVGAVYDDDNGNDSGSAYIFTRTGNTWTEQAKLLPSDGVANDEFGRSVALSGDTALVGRWLDDDNGENSGSAHIFTRTGNTWTQQAKLLPSDGAEGDHFGGCVALHGDAALVGAAGDDDHGDWSGSAYIFTRSGNSWNEQAKLLPSDGAEGDQVGFSVALSGDTALVGVVHDDDSGNNSGSAYIFTRTGNTWTEQAKLLASDGAEGDYFSVSAALDGDTALVGAYADDDHGENSGSAYTFDLTHTGAFVMGSPESEPCRDSDEGPAHEVTLTGSFWLKTTEVTQGEWFALMGNNPSLKSPDCDDCPVEYVNWWEALAHCNALSAADGLSACYTLTGCDDNDPGTDMECTGVTVNAPGESVYACEGYRLPTEAEWEYAARAGTTTATYNGDISATDCDDVSEVLEPIAWYAETSDSTTHPVAGKEPNPWGLHDMLGNVYEWTWDRNGDYDSGASEDPAGASSGSRRVIRGCSWDRLARDCRAAARSDDAPGDRFGLLGVRPARTYYPDNDDDGVDSFSDCDDNDPDVSTACCGNGTVDDGEACDDGGTEDGDGCSASCTSECAEMLGALSFDGGADRVELPAAVTAGLTAMTFSAWFRAEPGQSGYSNIVQQDNAYDQGEFAHWIRYFQGTSSFEFMFRSGQNGTAENEQVAPPSFDTWHHVALSWDGQTVTFYLNGASVGSGPVSGTMAGTNPIYIGNWMEGEGFNGLIDEVTYWDRALSEAEVVASMWSVPTSGDPGLIATYGFDAGSTNLGSDESGNGYHGTVYGAESIATASPCAVQSSCKAHLAAVPASPDGIYEIDPDGTGGAAPFDVYCDMTTDGGGWTVVESYDVTHKEAYKNQPFNFDFPRNEDGFNWDDYRLSSGRMAPLIQASTRLHARCHRAFGSSNADYFMGDIALVEGAFGDSAFGNMVDTVGANPYSVSGYLRGYSLNAYDVVWWHQKTAAHEWHPHFEGSMLPNATGSEDAFGWADGVLNPQHLCHTAPGEMVWMVR